MPGRGSRGLAFIVGSALLLVLSAILFAQVIFRYVIEQPLSWAEEAARFLLVWLAMLAAVIAARRGLHFVFRWGTIWLPKPARSVLRLFVNAVTVVIIAVIFVQCLAYFDLMGNQRTQATNVNMQLPVGGIVVGVFLLGAVYFLECLDQIPSASSPGDRAVTSRRRMRGR